MRLTSLDAYRHVMLDMNGTFLLDFDNFGAEQDFGATYRRLGYRTLSAERAHALVRAAYDHMAARYVDPRYYDDFPTVAQALAATSPELPEGVTAALVDTFACHELGHLPPAHREAISLLTGHRPLSVLSNLWAPPARWEALLERCGLRQNFTQVVYSCDARAIKPHPDIFRRALQGLRMSAGDVLYVGDSYRCDVGGAQAVGMDAVWLHGRQPVPETLPEGVYAAPDLVAWINELDITL